MTKLAPYLSSKFCNIRLVEPCFNIWMAFKIAVASSMLVLSIIGYCYFAGTDRSILFFNRNILMEDIFFTAGILLTVDFFYLTTICIVVNLNYNISNPVSVRYNVFTSTVASSFMVFEYFYVINDVPESAPIMYTVYATSGVMLLYVDLCIIFSIRREAIKRMKETRQINNMIKNQFKMPVIKTYPGPIPQKTQLAQTEKEFFGKV